MPLKATSAVYRDNNIGEWFQTTIGACQGCLLSPSLYDIFLERILADTLEDHEGTVSIGCRTITNLRFADEGLARRQRELVKLANHLGKHLERQEHHHQLMRFLAMSVCLYACETWTKTADIERRIEALEMRYFSKLLGVSYIDHITNEEVKVRIGSTIGPYEYLLTSVKRRRLKSYEHET